MSILRYLAAPLSPLYGMVVRARNRSFDAHPERAARVSVPVVSVGNLSAGGTGKTPLTLFLAEGLEAAGWANAVLSRGYGGRRDIDPMSVEPDSDPRQTGDEPLLMARRLGPERVVVGRKRHAAALRALAQRPELRCLLLDDGFQHRALHRDLDLLVLDGVRLWGNGRLLPLGDLREPMDSARRAHALVVTRAARVKDRPAVEAWWARHGSGGPVFWVDFALGSLRRWGPEDRQPIPLPGQGPAFAWCGLGHPEAFYADLLVAGQAWSGTHSYPDHQGPTETGLAWLQSRARELGSAWLVCTEKDAVKLGPAHRSVLEFPLYVAEQRVSGGEPLLAWILARLSGSAAAPSARTETGG
ncbi:tetraacyldisaccharide 4'-kinase [Geothrix fermentans]|jgi:tetraacyldisaccharide 4'-kinase|uniref:tetraacyldisaccharide 4'-kinase n=1 Tax=Geothrix fermentans TaxID=44676 RepID=UPI0003FA292C|nr:tetraacyldisaccharide 4'-kinase [Geothrix fermentans]